MDKDVCENCRCTLVAKVHKKYSQEHLIDLADRLEKRHTQDLAEVCDYSAKVVRSFITGTQCSKCGYTHTPIKEVAMKKL